MAPLHPSQLEYLKLMNKTDEFTNLIDVNHIDIACLTETWLSDEIHPCVTVIEGYTCEKWCPYLYP